MIESISVKNYRGIENLELNNFKRYNFFVGDNSSCKTTLLEAIFSSTISNLSGIIVSTNSKGEILKSENINSLFYNADSSNEIEFVLNNSIKTRIRIENFYNNQSINLENLRNKDNLKFLYNIVKEVNEKKELDLDILINEKFQYIEKQNIITEEFNKYSTVDKTGVFISPFTKYLNTTAQTIKKLIEDKQKNKLLEVLNIFEKDIDDIVSDGTQILLSKKNIKKMLPISSFGNGLSSILDIVASLITVNSSYIFIDEIETGIHYLNYEKFIKALIGISESKDIQLFMTTHSKEFLEIFYRELDKNSEDICLYRFQKIKDKLSKVYYPKERAINAMKNGWDIR
ncbi:AAA family ATPase [uncultured Fusobacterium sp.]|uniref:AAA family ATPase n=1 Tax=uncultured Fusobacterium sp. TaxID=159267 RepID=UPI0025CF8B7C|nr:AAA family ATPase [uncultured Fusobacterium sp.]